MIVFDASVVSASLGRRPRLVGRDEPVAAEVARVLASVEPSFVPGIAAQELLSGARSPEQEHRNPARISNERRWNGVVVGTADCLIAAQTLAGRARPRVVTFRTAQPAGGER